MSFKNRLSIIAFLPILLLLSACMPMASQPRFNPNPEPPVRMDIESPRGQGYFLKLLYVISPGTPQQWNTSIKQREYVVQHITSSEVTIEEVVLVDAKGAFHPMQAPDAMRSVSEVVEMQTNQGYAGYGATIGGTVLGAFSGLPLGTLANLYSAVAQNNSSISEVKETEKLASELNKRMLPPRLELDRGAVREGSYFFPAVEPRAIVVRYRTMGDRQQREVRMALTNDKNLASTR